MTTYFWKARDTVFDKKANAVNHMILFPQQKLFQLELIQDPILSKTQ